MQNKNESQIIRKAKSVSAVLMLVAVALMSFVAVMPGAVAAGEKVRGKVTTLGSGAPLQDAWVWVYQISTGFFYMVGTNTTGQYSVLLPGPGTYEVMIGKNGYSGNISTMTFGLGQSIDHDVALAPDTDAPVISTFNIDVVKGISINNPATVTMTVQEKWLQNDDVWMYQIIDNAGVEYDLRLLKFYTDTSFFVDPGLPIEDIAMTQTAPGTNTTTFTFDGTAPTAIFSDGTRQWYVTYSAPTWNAGAVDIVFVKYENTTMGANPDGWYMEFNSTTHALKQIDRYNETLGFVPNAVNLSDASGRVMVMQQYATFNTTSLERDTEYKNVTPFIAVNKVAPISYQPTLPTGNYLAIARAGDFGQNRAIKWKAISVDNDVPIADAGVNITIRQGQTAILNGTASSDGVGIENFTWTYSNATESFEVYGPNPETAVFDDIGVIEVLLNVTDFGKWKASDKTYINITDGFAPIADAGSNISVMQNVEFQLDGSKSTDNINLWSQLNYTWSFNDTVQNVTLFGWNATCTLSKIGVYPFKLVVRDISGLDSQPDTVWVNVTDGTAPVANAGLDFSVKQNALAVFNGSASIDNVGIVNYTWNFTDKGLPVKIFGWNATFIFDTMGKYNVTLTVKDKAGIMTSDMVVVTVIDGISPMANAGNDTTDEIGANITFNASLSTDNVGIVTYNWTFDDGNWSHGMVAMHAYATVGKYNVTLTCIDAEGNIGTDLVVVIVGPKNNPPVVPVIPPQTAMEGTQYSYKPTYTDADVTDTLTISLKDAPAGMTVNSATGLISWLPATNQVWKTYNVSFVVTDKKVSVSRLFTITVVAKTIIVNLGPIKDSDGKVLRGADVVVMLGSENYAGKTDSKGYVQISVPGTWADRLVDVQVKKSNYETKTFTGTVNKDGSFDPTGGTYPKVKSKQSEDYTFLVIVIIVLLILALVLFSMKRPTEPEGDTISGDEDDDETEEALTEEE